MCFRNKTTKVSVQDWFQSGLVCDLLVDLDRTEALEAQRVHCTENG